MSITWLIPIKDNSERLSHKSLRSLTGRPLFEWTVDHALASATGRVVVMTLGPESYNLATTVTRTSSAEVLKRPDSFTGDSPGLMHAIRWAIDELPLPEDDEHGVGILLPTSPFRTAATIRRCVDLWKRDKRASVCTVAPVCNASMRYRLANGWLGTLVPPGFDRHAHAAKWEDVPPLLLSTGGVQLTSTETFMAFGRFWIPKARAVEVDVIEGLDIDTPDQWLLAEAVAKSRGTS